MSSKETIAVDIDDVLAQHIEAFIEFSNERYGTSFTETDYNEQWSEFWGIDHDEVEERATIFHHPDTVGSFGVIEGALPVLTDLQKTWELVIVTARPRHTINATHNWVQTNFPGIFTDVYFVPIWEPGPKQTKAEICKNIGAEYLIDDLARHCNIAANVGIRAVLFARSKWKQPEPVRPDVYVARNWLEVAEYFDGKS